MRLPFRSGKRRREGGDLFGKTHEFLRILFSQGFRNGGQASVYAAADLLKIMSSGFREPDDDPAMVCWVYASPDIPPSLQGIQQMGNPRSTDAHGLFQFSREDRVRLTVDIPKQIQLPPGYGRAVASLLAFQQQPESPDHPILDLSQFHCIPRPGGKPGSLPS